jgi:GAF domain-containing protein
MQTMADQVAVAIDNARLYSETQTALRNMQATQDRYLAQSWMMYARRRTTSGYQQAGNTLTPLGAQPLPEVEQAARQGQAVIQGGDEQAESSTRLSVPIVLRGRPIGALGVRKDGAPVSAEEVELAQDIGEQFALAAENLRLFEETQRRAARERLTRQITDNIRAAVSVEDAVQRAVQELGRALGAAELVARVGTEKELLSGGQGDHHG